MKDFLRTCRWKKYWEREVRHPLGHGSILTGIPELKMHNMTTKGITNICAPASHQSHWNLLTGERESTWSVCSFLNRSAFYFVFLISQRHWSKGFPKLSHKSSWSFQAISAKMFKACQSTSMDHFSQMNVCAVACSYDSWAVLSHWNHHNLVLAI